MTPAPAAYPARLAKGVAPRSVREALATLKVLGVHAEPIREDRVIIGYAFAFPPEAPWPRVEVVKPDNYRHFPVEWLWWGSPDRAADRAANRVHPGRPAFAWLRERAAQVAGAADPAVARAQARDQQGRPALPRDRDPAVRTCGACFRTFKATAADTSRRGAVGKRGPQHWRIVDHGYSIAPGWRTGSCWGVGLPPLEESSEAVQRALDDAHVYARGVHKRILLLAAALRSSTKAQALGSRQVGTGRLERDPQTRRHVEVLVAVGPDDPRWRRSVEIESNEHLRLLRHLWSSNFESIPWLRAVLREWTPQAPEVVPPKGAPLVSPVPGDFKGKPRGV